MCRQLYNSYCNIYKSLLNRCLLTPIIDNIHINNTFRQRYQQAYHNNIELKQIKKEYHKEWWQENKDRYKRRHIARLGNPEQDNQVLQFIHDKRDGKQIPRYRSLPIHQFKYNNHAYCPKYYNEIIKGEIEWNPY